MDWIKDALPDDSQTLWLVIICIALALLNVYQYARAHDLAGTVKLLLEHGHAPEGKVIVPAVDVARAIEAPKTPSHLPGWPIDRPLPDVSEGAVIQPRSAIPTPPPAQDDSGWRPQPAIPPLPWEKS